MTLCIIGFAVFIAGLIIATNAFLWWFTTEEQPDAEELDTILRYTEL